MECVQSVAKYICDEYKRVSGELVDEMKLHKLLYFTQRESLAVTGQPMFDADFEGWRHGPVCREVRASFFNGQIYGTQVHKISPGSAYIARNVIEGYGPYASWKLSELSHRELSWNRARKGLEFSEDGSRPLLIADIRLDAKNVRPYDFLFDMYFDEFDDIGEWIDLDKAVAL